MSALKAYDKANVTDFQKKTQEFIGGSDDGASGMVDFISDHGAVIGLASAEAAYQITKPLHGGKGSLIANTVKKTGGYVASKSPFKKKRGEEEANNGGDDSDTSESKKPLKDNVKHDIASLSSDIKNYSEEYGKEQYHVNYKSI